MTENCISEHREYRSQLCVTYEEWYRGGVEFSRFLLLFREVVLYTTSLQSTYYNYLPHELMCVLLCSVLFSV